MSGNLENLGTYDPKWSKKALSIMHETDAAMGYASIRSQTMALRPLRDPCHTQTQGQPPEKAVVLVCGVAHDEIHVASGGKGHGGEHAMLARMVPSVVGQSPETDVDHERSRARARWDIRRAPTMHAPHCR